MTRHRQAARAEQRPARVLCGEEFNIPAFVESSPSEVMTGWRCQPEAVARFRVCWLGRLPIAFGVARPSCCGDYADAMPRRSSSTAAGSSDASTIRAVLRPARGLIPRCLSRRAKTPGSAREEMSVLGFDVGQGGSSTGWQLREQVGQDWRQQKFVIAEHKVGVAGSLTQRVARAGKYASQVEPVEQHEARTAHEGRRRWCRR